VQRQNLNQASRINLGEPHRSLRTLLSKALLATLVTTTGCGSLGGNSNGASLFSQPMPQVTKMTRPQSPVLSAHTPTASPIGQAVLPAAVVAASYPGDAHGGVGLGDYSTQSSDSYIADATATGCQVGNCMDQSCVSQNCAACAPTAVGARFRNAQEYIFDGGDQQPAVVVKQDWSTAGVDPTDTVIHYETLAGTVCVQATNRVPIYAPRFGAVRQVSGLQLSTRAVGTERILAPVAAERFDDKNLAGMVVLPVAPQGEQQVGLIDAFQENKVGTPLDQIQPLSRMSSARVPFELIDPRRTGLITRQELIDIRQLIQNAETWVIRESLMIEISGQPALEVVDTQAAEDYVLYESPNKCAMRICKAASHTIANSGDIVSFAIRFDNAGTKPLGNVVITDSLSPRLNYIDGSQQCSIGVRFSAEPNDVGSMVLRWELEEPVEPSEGGVITFDCQVR
jgi:uncharacterized repeat protein (TIGR01451 family)